MLRPASHPMPEGHLLHRLHNDMGILSDRPHSVQGALPVSTISQSLPNASKIQFYQLPGALRGIAGVSGLFTLSLAFAAVGRSMKTIVCTCAFQGQASSTHASSPCAAAMQSYVLACLMWCIKPGGLLCLVPFKRCHPFCMQTITMLCTWSHSRASAHGRRDCSIQWIQWLRDTQLIISSILSWVKVCRRPSTRSWVCCGAMTGCHIRRRELGLSAGSSIHWMPMARRCRFQFMTAAVYVVSLCS